MLDAGRQQHHGDVDPLAVIVLRQGDQRSETLEVEIAGIVRRQAARAGRR